MRTRDGRGRRSPFLLAGVVGLALAMAGPATAQTQFIPYYGKNLIHYDTFDWHIYQTDHFEIFYYPAIESHLERIAGYVESAYQQVSADLKHDLATRVPIIIFKTHSEFEQENVIPGAAQEGVAAFAESTQGRMLLPIDDPPDLLYGLIVHELTHVFEFDIIPQSLIRRNIPLWVNEGLSDYERAQWRPIDLMTVRDAAVADIIPKMSDLEGYGGFDNPRLIYNLGHAVFEFIESRWGKEGIRQFLFALRKSVIGGGENAYEEAFRLKPQEFDEQFEKYLKERFKPFRDKERPADYGRNLAPDKEKTRYTQVLSVEPSPSGDLIAAVTVNRRDQEYDIVLLSSKDGEVIRNLTSGFDKDLGFEYLSIPGMRFNSVPWVSWAPSGDRIAYFVRTEKQRSLILQNVVTKKIERRVEIKLDEAESPDIAPNGRLVAFSALNNAVGDIYTLDLETGSVDNLTKDDFFDYAPTFSPDGKFIVYMERVSGSEKLFRFDLDTRKKTQLTFGTHDDSGAQFLDADTIVFSSTATNPLQPIEPEVARNGNIYNLWTLNLKNGELKQYTDAVGGILSPIVMQEGADKRHIVFVTYNKGDFGLHTLDKMEPIVQAASSDFGAPGPIIDFQAPLSHTLVAGNKRKKRAFEKLFVDGRPPVNVGVTSGGDVYGGSQISFADVLGDQRFDLFASSVAQYRSLAFSYLNLSRRLQYAMQAFSQTQFFYGQLGGLLYDPIYSGLIDRDLAQATRTVRGGSVFAIYPFNRYARVELFGGVMQYREEYNNPDLQDLALDYQVQNFGRQLFRSGTFIPLGLAYVQETTVFREFGPLAGNTVRLGYEVSPKLGNSLSRQTADADARYYLRLGGSGLLALRARAFKSWGDSPDFMYFGGNSEMRGYEYLEFLGQNAYFANAELRFPFIQAMLTPLGVLGGVRGVFFANMGGAWFNETPFKFFTSKAEPFTPLLGYQYDPRTLLPQPVYGPTQTVTGFRLRDARASYGVGLETFALGFPIHFDWSWRTLFNRQWEDLLFAADGGSAAFRRARFNVWIGYDF
ncbi:MAG: BamA/TamA family outer membrane protein [Acidobacteria bacterium]|nr:BamA/TamA family outer membrane protein [Acidobacteriota bacterium]